MITPIRYKELGDVQVGDVIVGLICPCKLIITKKQPINNGDLKGHSLYTARYIDGPNTDDEINIYDFMAYKKEN